MKPYRTLSRVYAIVLALFFLLLWPSRSAFTTQEFQLLIAPAYVILVIVLAAERSLERRWPRPARVAGWILRVLIFLWILMWVGFAGLAGN